jgi:hypothetical protein
MTQSKDKQAQLTVDRKEKDYQKGEKGKDMTRKAPKTYHTSILPIPTLHLHTHLKPHPLINLHIRHILRTLQITLNPLPIRPLRHSLKKHPPDPLPLRLRTHSDNITKVISPGIIPNRRLRFLLPGFPDPVPIRAETAVAAVADVGD